MLKTMKGRKMENAQRNLPYNLTLTERMRNFYVEPTGGVPTARKLSSSLGYQMTRSVDDLMAELKEAGKDYELHLVGGFHGDERGRWQLYVNGEHLATIDENYGYECFDESGTRFKETVAKLIEQSGIQPLTAFERAVLDAQVKAMRIIESKELASRS